MIAEAIKLLNEMTLASATPRKIDIPDPRNAHYVITGKAEELMLPAPPRKHAADSLDDLIALANRFEEVNTADNLGMPVVWHDEKAVILIIDDDGHRVETATLTFNTSDVWDRIVRLRDAKEWMEPKPFIRLLRVELAGTIAPGELLNKVRVFKFDTTSSLSGAVTRERESLGREITSKVHTETEIPEEVTLLTPVYSTFGEVERYPVRCAVEVDPQRGAFQLIPLPDEIERVLQMAVSSVTARLAERLKATVPHYHGRP